MNNPYCASFEKVRDLYVTHMKAQSRKNYDSWATKLPRTEIKRQLDTQTGGLIEGLLVFNRNCVRHWMPSRKALRKQ